MADVFSAEKRATGRDWFKSSFSNGSCTCVEVRLSPDHVEIRDSKFLGDPSVQPVITVASRHWTTLQQQIRLKGPLGIGGVLDVAPHPDGSASLYSPANGTELRYTAAEWAAYVAGVRAGEFDLVMA